MQGPQQPSIITFLTLSTKRVRHWVSIGYSLSTIHYNVTVCNAHSDCQASELNI